MKVRFFKLCFSMYACMSRLRLGLELVDLAWMFVSLLSLLYVQLWRLFGPDGYSLTKEA